MNIALKDLTASMAAARRSAFQTLFDALIKSINEVAA